MKKPRKPRRTQRKTYRGPRTKTPRYHLDYLAAWRARERIRLCGEGARMLWFPCPAEIWTRLKAQATAEGRKPSWVCLRAIRAYLAACDRLATEQKLAEPREVPPPPIHEDPPGTIAF